MFFDEFVSVLLSPSESVTVSFIPEVNVTGGRAMMNVVGLASSSCTPSPQSSVTLVVAELDIVMVGLLPLA